MFITHFPFKYPNPKDLISVHEQYWMAVGLVVERVWFLVRIYQLTSFDGFDNYDSVKTMMVANVADIERLAQEGPDFMPRFESAQIVTPGELNGTGTWKIDRLKAVWTADDPSNPDAKVEICETMAGAKFVISVCSAPVDKLRNQKFRYKFPAANSTA